MAENNELKHLCLYLDEQRQHLLAKCRKKSEVLPTSADKCAHDDSSSSGCGGSTTDDGYERSKVTEKKNELENDEEKLIACDYKKVSVLSPWYFQSLQLC